MRMNKKKLYFLFCLVLLIGAVLIQKSSATDACHCPPGHGLYFLCQEICGGVRECESCLPFYDFGVCYGIRCEWIYCCICIDGDRGCGTATNGTLCRDCL